MTRRTLLAALLTTATLACGEATAPSRNDLYEWRLVVGTDTLSFHWPKSALPVKVWVQDTLDMPDRVQEGIAAWRGAFLYGEYDAILVADSAAADVVVRVVSALPGSPAPVLRFHAAFPGCEGETVLDADTATTPATLRLPIRMRITPRFNPATNDLTDCFRATATHELGHSLGIFTHSPDADDLMFGGASAVLGPSPRDVNTAQALAHYPSNMTLTR